LLASPEPFDEILGQARLALRVPSIDGGPHDQGVWIRGEDSGLPGELGPSVTVARASRILFTICIPLSRPEHRVGRYVKKSGPDGSRRDSDFTRHQLVQSRGVFRIGLAAVHIRARGGMNDDPRTNASEETSRGAGLAKVDRVGGRIGQPDGPGIADGHHRPAGITGRDQDVRT
jgi:hypothetical protein